MRRLHDTERSAWWLLLYPAIVLVWIIGVGTIGGLILLAGVVALVVTLVVLCALPGTSGPNRYGPDPLQPDMGMSGYGYADPGHPYAPSPLGGTATEVTPEPGGRLYCSQCGAERQADARFCTVCGAGF